MCLIRTQCYPPTPPHNTPRTLCVRSTPPCVAVHEGALHGRQILPSLSLQRSTITKRRAASVEAHVQCGKREESVALTEALTPCCRLKLLKAFLQPMRCQRPARWQCQGGGSSLLRTRKTHLRGRKHRDGPLGAETTLWWSQVGLVDCRDHSIDSKVPLEEGSIDQRSVSI